MNDMSGWLISSTSAQGDASAQESSDDDWDACRTDLTSDDCSQMMEQLDAYLHADLPDQQREQLAGHLRRCAGCSDEADAFEAQQHIVLLLRRCCPQNTPAPQQLHQRLHLLIEQMAPLECGSLHGKQMQINQTQMSQRQVFTDDGMLAGEQISMTHTSITLRGGDPLGDQA